MELIQICQRELSPGQTVETVNARDLWVFVESRQQFADWIGNRIEKYSFAEGSDYLIHKVMNNSKGGPPSKEYHVSVDMAKQLAMVENSIKGQEIRRYFIECERMAKAKAAVPAEADLLTRTLNDPASLRQLLLDNVEKVIALQSQVAAQAPTVAAYDRIATFTDGSLCITDTAKALQITPKSLFLWLQAHDWIYKRTGCSHYVAYQPKLKQGFLEHKITTIKVKQDPNDPDKHIDKPEKIVEQVRVTSKGLSALSKVFSQPVMDLS